MITHEIVVQFKERMHIDGGEDDNLKRILTMSTKELRRVCGDYDLSDDIFKELVFERSRYVYNDAVEYFKRNFLTEINSLSMEKVLTEDGDD